MKTVKKILLWCLIGFAGLVILGALAGTSDEETHEPTAITTTNDQSDSVTTVVTTTTKKMGASVKTTTTVKTQKATTTTVFVAKPTTVTTQKTTQVKPQETMVWIPTKGGKRYHCVSDCSGMEDPRYVTISEAIEEGFTPCGRCY